MNVFLGIQNNQVSYDQKIEKLQISIKKANASLDVYLDSKADQLARRKIGLLGQMFSSPKPILPALLNLSTEVREIYKQGFLLSSEMESDRNINQESKEKLRLVFRSVECKNLINKTQEAIREKHHKGEAVGVTGWFYNKDEGIISTKSALEFAKEIDEWRTLPGCNGILNRPQEIEDIGPRRPLPLRGLSSLSVSTVLRGGALFSALTFGVVRPMKALVGAGVLSSFLIFPSSRRFLQDQLVTTGKDALNLTLALGDSALELGEKVMSAKPLSNSSDLMKEEMQNSKALGRLIIEVAKNVTITALSTLTI